MKQTVWLEEEKKHSVMHYSIRYRQFTLFRSGIRKIIYMNGNKDIVVKSKIYKAKVEINKELPTQSQKIVNQLKVIQDKDMVVHHIVNGNSIIGTLCLERVNTSKIERNKVYNMISTGQYMIMFCQDGHNIASFRSGLDYDEDIDDITGTNGGVGQYVILKGNSGWQYTV